MTPQDIAARIQSIALKGKRRLIAIVGAPASGKSTLAEDLAQMLPHAAAVPMDGFHLDNALLSARGDLARKGAPHTFDAAGFTHMIKRLQSEDDVIYPRFDRALDSSIAGAGCVSARTQTVIVEGNYLLLDAPNWRDLAGIWDLSIALDVPEDTLRDRLIARWMQHGFDKTSALAKAEANDLPNAQLIAARSLPADLRVTL